MKLPDIVMLLQTFVFFFNECSGNVADVQWLAQPKKTRKRSWEFRCGLKGIDMDVPTNRGYDAPIDMRNSFAYGK